MNTPNPLVPAGSLKDQSKGKSNVRLAVFAVLAVHMVVLMSFLIAGCRPEKPAGDTAATNDPPVPVWAPETNAAQAAVLTNPPVETNIATNLPVITPATTVTEITPMVTNVVESNLAMREYTIQKGDYFALIAKKHRLSLQAISNANPGVDSTRLKVGQKIQLPAAAETSSNGATVKTGADLGAGEAIYTVKAGDNLTRIARNHGSTPLQIRKMNNLKTDQIRAGQKLKVPSKNVAAPAAPGNPTSPDYVTPLPGGTVSPGTTGGPAPR